MAELNHRPSEREQDLESDLDLIAAKIFEVHAEEGDDADAVVAKVAAIYGQDVAATLAETAARREDPDTYIPLAHRSSGSLYALCAEWDRDGVLQRERMVEEITHRALSGGPREKQGPFMTVPVQHMSFTAGGHITPPEFRFDQVRLTIPEGLPEEAVRLLIRRQVEDAL